MTEIEYEKNRYKNMMYGQRRLRSLIRYIEQVERIQDGYRLPNWKRYRRWLTNMPVTQLKARVNRDGPNYYVEKFGYVKTGEGVYEVDQKVVGLICTVVILAWGGVAKNQIARTLGISYNRVEVILKNYKYYVGWHNAYTEDGRRIWPAIREVALIHKDMTGEEVMEAKQDVIECQPKKQL